MGEHIRVLPQPGLFVLFPAWLQHYVVAHTGNRSRVSVSFNARITFPEDDEIDQGAEASPPETPPHLTFTVPGHHQSSFLDGALARDMVVS